MASKAELALMIKIRRTGEDLLTKQQNEIRKLAGEAERAQKHLGGLGGMLEGLGKIGLAGLGVSALQGLAGALRGPIDAASDLAESASKVGVVFGQSAADVEAFSKSSATALGMSRQKALEAAGTFGNLFTSMGLGQKPAADMSQDLLTLAADLGSFNNIDVGEALEKLRSGLVGESEPLRALGINLTAAAVEAKAMEMGLVDVNGEVTEAGKLQARYALIVEQSKNAQGDFARTSTGLANAQRIIGASFDDLRTNLGSRFLPIIAKAASAFATALPAALEALEPVLDAVGGAFESLAGGAVDALTSLWSQAQPALEALMGGLGRVREFVGQLIGYFQEGNQFDLMGALFGPDVGPRIDEVVRAVKGLVGTVGDFTERLIPSIQAMLSGDLDFSEWALDWIGAFRDGFGRFLGAVATLVEGAVPGIVEQVSRWASAFGEWVGPAAQQFLTEWPGQLERILDAIADAVGPIMGKLLEWGKAFVEWIGPRIPDILKALALVAAAIVVFIGSTILVLARKLGEWAVEFVAWVGPSIPPMLAELGKLAASIVRWAAAEGIPALVKVGGDLAAGLLRGLQNSIRGMSIPLPDISVWWEKIADLLGNAIHVPRLTVGIKWESLAKWIPEAREAGGAVDKLRPYWVGEKGKELFIPQTAGAILPASATAAVLGRRPAALGASSIVWQGDVVVQGSVVTERDLTELVYSGLVKKLKANGRVALG